MSEKGQLLLAIYKVLFSTYGSQHWWPSRSGSIWEIMAGAVLTQHTSWTNVEMALANIVSAWGESGLTSPETILEAPDALLNALLRPTGHYETKPHRLRNLAQFVVAEGGPETFARTAEPTSRLRERLLAIGGIGPETADAILLYALGRPVFIADAYAGRLASRWGLMSPGSTYSQIQSLFMDNLPHDAPLFDEYHALIVAHGKDLCRPRPLCPRCPLAKPIPVVEKSAGEEALEWACPKLFTPFGAIEFSHPASY